MQDLLEVLLKGLIIYLGGLFLIRISHKRFLGRETPFDVLLAFILGSTLSRGITGSATLVGTLAASALLIIIHAGVGTLTFYSPWFAKTLKGKPEVLFKDGKINPREMKKYLLTEGDLLEALRINAHLAQTGQARLIQMEPNGSISIIPEKRQPKILEVAVEAGVKTVRLQLE